MNLSMMLTTKPHNLKPISSFVRVVMGMALYVSTLATWEPNKCSVGYGGSHRVPGASLNKEVTLLFLAIIGVLAIGGNSLGVNWSSLPFLYPSLYSLSVVGIVTLVIFTGFFFMRNIVLSSINRLRLTADRASTFPLSISGKAMVKCFIHVSIVLFLQAICNAQQANVQQSYIDFSGGLNDYKASVYLEKNESPDLLNVQIDEPLGALSQRNGWEACGVTPSGNTATNLYEYAKNNGSRYLIVTDNSSIWQTADCSNYTQISAGHNPLATPRFATVHDTLWITNGSDSVETWDGTTLTLLDGQGTTPNVPKGKLIAWWKGRVWMGATDGEPSGAYFSTLVSPSGQILDPATSSVAWANTNNLVYFNRGDGSRLYGLKVYRDNLYAFKETGINRVIFQSEYNVNVVKNVTTIGSKFQESIQEMDDGFLRFVGRDGVYKFDGSTVMRTSTKWSNTFKTLQQPFAMVENYHAWNDTAEWSLGTKSGLINPVDKPNSLTMITGGQTVGPNIGGELNATTHWDTLDGFAIDATRAQFGTYSIKTTVHHYLDQYPGITVTVKDNLGNTLDTDTLDGNIGSWGSKWITWVPALNTSTVYVWFTYSVDTGPSTTVTKTIKYGPVMPGAGDIQGNGSYLSGLRIYAYLGGADGSHYTAFDIDEPAGESTSIYESQAFHAVNLSDWGAFTVSESVNGGNIAHFIRTATTEAGLASVPYTTIISGADVSTGTDTWVQFKSSVTTSDYNNVPEITSTAINWITGLATKSLLSGINYKGRYWLAASTTTDGLYNDIVMVESKPPLESHTRYDLSISAMAIWNGNLYGAIGGTDKIARLDYGSTDNGDAIISYWNSRDELFDNPLAYKSVNKVILDFASTPPNKSLQVALSPDFGASYQTIPVDTTLSGLPRMTRNVNFAANRSLEFRTRIYNSQLGVGFRIYGIHGFGTASQFVGN